MASSQAYESNNVKLISASGHEEHPGLRHGLQLDMREECLYLNTAAGD